VDEIRPIVADAYLHHRGEPLMHPDIDQMVEYASKGGLKTRIHTNGILLNKGLAKELIASGLEQITVSIDILDPEIYRRNRPEANLEKVLNNLENFLEERRLAKKKRPFVHLLLMGQNDKKISIKKFPLKLKPDRIIYRKVHNWGGSLEENMTEDIFNTRLCNCTFPWYSLVIFFDGKVCLCPQDFFGKMIVGDLKSKTLNQIWQSEEMANFRKEIFSRKFQTGNLCVNCDRIRRKSFGGIPIEYLLKFLKEVIF